jgi:hypothetical protein
MPREKENEERVGALIREFSEDRISNGKVNLLPTFVPQFSLGLTA